MIGLKFQIDVPEDLVRRTIRHLAASGKIKKKGAKWQKADADEALPRK